MRSLHLVALVAFSSIAAASAFALPVPTPSEKAAVKMVSAAQAPIFAALKHSLALTSSTFFQELTNLEADLALGGDGPAAAEELFNQLVSLQQNVTNFVGVTASDRANAMSSLLSSFAVGTEGVYPGAFYPGPGTQVTKFDAAVSALLAKTYIKLRKRVAKTTKKLAAAGMSVHTLLNPPRLPPRTWTTFGIDFFLVHQPSIDIAVASSTFAFGGDGSLRVGGEAEFLATFAEDVSVTASFNLNAPTVTTTPAGGRYSVEVADATLEEGVWLIGVAQESGIPMDTIIAIR